MILQGYVPISFDRTVYTSVSDKAVQKSLFNMAVDKAAHSSVLPSKAKSTALINLNPLTPQKVSCKLH
jgi:hypothetical protein